jgi:hypothetical protein
MQIFFLSILFVYAMIFALKAFWDRTVVYLKSLSYAKIENKGNAFIEYLKINRKRRLFAISAIGSTVGLTGYLVYDRFFLENKACAIAKTVSFY